MQFHNGGGVKKFGQSPERIYCYGTGKKGIMSKRMSSELPVPTDPVDSSHKGSKHSRKFRLDDQAKSVWTATKENQ